MPRLALVLAALVATPLALAAEPAPDPAPRLAGYLPVEMHAMTTVSAGDAIYTFGGFRHVHLGVGASNGFSDTILRYEPGSPLALPLPTSLPSPRAHMAGVWDPRPLEGCAEGCAYLLGGIDPGAAALASILRFDAASGRIVDVGALPEPRLGAASVWTGERALLFGGYAGSASSERSSAILEYDPVSRVVTERVARLPAPTAYAGAVWDATPSAACPEGCAYIFGGLDATPGGDLREDIHDAVVRYDPARDRVDVVASLPTGRYWMGAAMLDGRALLFGGQAKGALFGGTFCTDEVLRFDPAAATVEVLDARLPTRRSAVGGASLPGAAYAVGGGQCSILAPGDPALTVSYASPLARREILGFGGAPALVAASG